MALSSTVPIGAIRLFKPLARPSDYGTIREVKIKCVKSIRKELTLKFGEGINMGEVVDTTGRVLVCRVQGSTYSTERLKLSVKEIWGNIFKDLPEVQKLARGWFTLHFQ